MVTAAAVVVEAVVEVALVTAFGPVSEDRAEAGLDAKVVVESTVAETIFDVAVSEGTVAWSGPRPNCAHAFESRDEV